jgi:hypothetical protein
MTFVPGLWPCEIPKLPKTVQKREIDRGMVAGPLSIAFLTPEDSHREDFAEIDGAFFDGAAKVTVGGLDAAVYPLGSYQTCDGCEVAIFIQIPGPVAVGSTTLVLTQISGQPGVMFIPAAGHTQGHGEGEESSTWAYF